MKRFSDAFGFLQKVGKSLMLPVAVLPIAGLLLGIGAAPFSWMPPVASQLMKDSGDVIFTAMPLLFAIAVAIGFTQNDGVSSVAATVGYTVMLATLGVMAGVWHQTPVTVLGVPSMQTGVFGGILAGAVAAAVFNRFNKLKLPTWLGFFSGKRSVPILTAFAALLLGLVLSVAWPPVQHGINLFSHWAAKGDPRTAATVYGFVERLLVPFGLHHIWNAPFFYEIGSFTEPSGKVVHGDIQRYFAGDPSAGILGGAYLFKMFGLPAAALAIWRSAKKQNRRAVSGIMFSAALTSAVTGITEPIEFAFLFVAPELYLVHALLAAACQFLMASLGGHLGFTFSQGGIDFVLFNVLNPSSQRWWLVLVLGPPVGLLYYTVFRLMIRWRDAKTPGREDTPTPVAGEVGAEATARGERLLAAFGGADNLANLDACITRLRVTVKRPEAVDAGALRTLGATGVLTVGNAVQAVFGPLSEQLKGEMEAAMKQPPAPARREAPALGEPAALASTADDRRDAATLLKALGGARNVERLECVALTRVRAELADPFRLDEVALRGAGVAPMHAGNHVVHLVVGERAAGLTAALQEARARAA